MVTLFVWTNTINTSSKYLSYSKSTKLKNIPYFQWCFNLTADLQNGIPVKLLILQFVFLRMKHQNHVSSSASFSINPFALSATGFNRNVRKLKQSVLSLVLSDGCGGQKEQNARGNISLVMLLADFLYQA